MRRVAALLSGGEGIRIKTEAELRRFVVCVTALCVWVAVSLDVANQLVFFDSWHVAIRSWTISTAIAAIIALPVSWAIARAYLALYRAKVAVDELSRTDPLTGLLNRRALFERAAVPPDVMALVIVDIDRFKRINDSHGHLVGDEVIRTVGRMMAHSLGDLGTVARLGGEEFALVSSDGDEVRLTARLREFGDRIAAIAIVSGAVTASVTVSAGIASRKPGQTFEQLYAEADRALYVAKAAGRNRIVAARDVSFDAAGFPEAGTVPLARSGTG